jgi:Ni/Co efflux regulator RcnB
LHQRSESFAAAIRGGCIIEPDWSHAMKTTALICSLTALSFAAVSLPALAQGRVPDRNASNNPEIYRQTHPEDAGSAQDLQGRPLPFDRGEADRRDQANRDQASRDAARRDADRRDSARREADRQQPNRREPDRRPFDRRDDGRRGGGAYDGYAGYGWGYVAPPPVFYSPPPAVYYNGPPPSYYYGTPGPRPLQPGDYLPPEYLAAQYIVQDWQWRGLSAPPYGYQWVQLGTGYALVVSSTGQIASIVATQ